MIVITGSVLARQDTFDELRALCVAHSQRSRTEPGCRHHAVHVDAETPLRLVFLELWADRTVVHAHFGDPDARAFIGRARKLAAEAPAMQIYEASEIDVASLAN